MASTEPTRGPLPLRAGGFVARNAAITHPTRVARLVLVGTGFPSSNSVTRELQAAQRDLPDPIPVDFARDFHATRCIASYPRRPERVATDISDFQQER